jgi:hypothetical protein
MPSFSLTKFGIHFSLKIKLLLEFQWQKQLFKRCGLGDLHPTKQIKQTTFLNSKIIIVFFNKKII